MEWSASICYFSIAELKHDVNVCGRCFPIAYLFYIIHYVQLYQSRYGVLDISFDYLMHINEEGNFKKLFYVTANMLYFAIFAYVFFFDSFFQLLFQI